MIGVLVIGITLGMVGGIKLVEFLQVRAERRERELWNMGGPLWLEHFRQMRRERR